MVLVKITQPKPGESFPVNQSFSVSGSAAPSVSSIKLYTPWGGTTFDLVARPLIVEQGTWSTNIIFNTAATREIIAEALDAEGNSLEFDTDIISVDIQAGMTKPVGDGCVVTSGFLAPGRGNHFGVDIAHTVTPLQKVFAIADGEVKLVVKNCAEGDTECGGRYGNVVYLNHPQLGLQTRYAHLSSVNVDQHQQVAQGQQIGIMGNTGYSFGIHLHFEVRRDGTPLNPLDFINPIV